MARIISEQDEKRLEAIQNLDHLTKMERQINKVKTILQKHHEIDMSHKLKYLFAQEECEICKLKKELE